MSDDPKKSPGGTDELPTLRNQNKPAADAQVNSLEASTLRKPSGTVIIADEVASPKRPITEIVEPAPAKAADAAPGKTDVPAAGRPVSKTLPSDVDDAPKRPGLTAIDPPAPRDVPAPRRVTPKKNGNLVFVIAGAALLAGAVIGGGIYVMKSGGDETEDIKPIATDKKPIANPASTTTPTTPTPTDPIPPVVVPTPGPTATTTTTTTTPQPKPSTSGSSSATPQNPFPFPTGFPTVIPSTIPTFPSAIPIPSWPPPN